MKKRNATLSALFTSVMCLLLCISMLVGTTFAWFTDSVVSGNNVIASGNLDIELEHAILNDDGSVKEWKTVKDATDLFSGALWEPGHTQVVYLKLSNLGTLALKYQLSINVASETGGINVDNNPFKLSDYIHMGVVEGAQPSFISREKAIEAAKAGANGIIGAGYTKSGSMLGKTTTAAVEEYLAVVVYMREEVDNVANHKTGTAAPVINLGINLFATQYTVEEDSFDELYDKGAYWAGAADTTWYNNTDSEFTLTTAEELAGLAAIVNAGTDTFKDKTIKLGANIDLNGNEGVLWTPIGNSTNKFQGTFIGTGYTISNLKVTGTNHVGLFGCTFSGAHIEGVTVENASVSGNDYVGVILGGGYLSQNCIKNCTVTGATVIATPYQLANGNYDGGAKAGVIVGQAYNGNITGCTVKNSTVTAYRDLGAIAGMHAVDGNLTVTASGNTVDTVTLSYIGVAGKYDGDKANENMAEIVGRVGNNAIVADNTCTAVTKNEDNKGATMIFTLDELIAFAKDVNAGNTYKGKTVILGADIDLNNMEWTPIGNSTNKFQGTFDGNDKTVSNLKVTGNNSNVGLFGFTTNGEIKNLTVKNANVSGYLNVGVIAGTPYTSKYNNITVEGHVEVNGFAYVGGVGGKNAYANWDNITVDVDETSYVKANSVENGTAYRTYVGGVVGFNGEGGHTFSNITSNIDVFGSTVDVGGAFGMAHYGNNFVNVTVTGNVTIDNAAEAGDAEEMGGIAGVWNNKDGYEVTFTNCSFTGNLSANITDGVDLSDNTITGAAYSADGAGKLKIDGAYVTADTATVDKSLQNGDDVVMAEDMTVSSKDTTSNSGYGATGVSVTNGATLDGNGKTLTVTDANTGWDCAVNTQNGTVKNLTVNGAFRGIFMGGASGDVYIDNVVIDKVCYTFNSDGGSKEYGVYISNSTLNGWTSFSDVHKEVVFTNCNFGKGTGGYKYAFCRPYNAPSVFKNCVFQEGFEFDTAKTSDILFENCYYGDTLITAENAPTLATGNVVFFYNGLNGITIK